MASRMALLMPLLLAALFLLSGYAQAATVVGFYDTSCPHAEFIVRKTVLQAIQANKNIGAGLLRMHFHDCFVRGCDASVLLDSVSGELVEKDAAPNKNSLRGFEVIFNIKAQLEKLCPNTVSCADITALTARDSIAILGGPFYELPTGRFDGRTSVGAETFTGLPPPIPDLPTLTGIFNKVGLSADDVVTLSGAHTIGQAHCITFASRLNPRDPVLNKKYAKQLLKACPIGASSNTTLVNMDPTSPVKFDNKYYRNLAKGKGLFASDQVLFTDASTKGSVQALAANNRLFFRKFADAIIRMGNIGVLSSTEGEVRKDCRLRN